MLRGGRIISTIGEPLTPPSFDSALELSFAHAKRDTIKDRNSIDLTEAEDVKKRWQEYTEELYKNDLNDPDNHDGVITHLEPDILEYKESVF